ncbi:MAG: T9SS type A sorting domain-containing protein [Ignavibacteria bacterium]|nr:T9SS type A sorting domain-containing protein [Ignavibacteria bacterium]
MKIKKTISRVIFFVFIFMLYINLTAFDDGIVGFTRKNGNDFGCICHGFFPDRKVTVIISGPSSVTVNDTATYTLRISGGPAVEAGCDISASMGNLIPSPLDTLLRRDESLPGSGFELTHKDPRPFTGSYVEFIFRYIAPPASGITDTIFANGNSVNHDFTSDNDLWNYADNFQVTITDIPQPVELSSFTYSVSGNNAELKWTTSEELNNAGFDIESADNSGSWIKKGFVSGKGNSGTPVLYSFTDRDLKSGAYAYRLKQIDYNGNFEYYYLSGEVVINKPEKYKLSQNYPNPFNPVTNVEFGISKLGFVSLKVYDMLGKEAATLVNEILSPGKYTVKFNGNNLASGVYFYRMESGDFKDIKRMVLVK